jgi:hypothetical protein
MALVITLKPQRGQTRLTCSTSSICGNLAQKSPKSAVDDGVDEERPSKALRQRLQWPPRTPPAPLRSSQSSSHRGMSEDTAKRRRLSPIWKMNVRLLRHPNYFYFHNELTNFFPHWIKWLRTVITFATHYNTQSGNFNDIPERSGWDMVLQF